MQQLEIEMKEIKENNEFLSNERDILKDTIENLEEESFKKSMEWLKQKEEYEKIVVYGSNLNLKSKKDE